MISVHTMAARSAAACRAWTVAMTSTRKPMWNPSGRPRYRACAAATPGRNLPHRLTPSAAERLDWFESSGRNARRKRCGGGEHQRRQIQRITELPREHLQGGTHPPGFPGPLCPEGQGRSARGRAHLTGRRLGSTSTKTRRKTGLPLASAARRPMRCSVANYLQQLSSCSCGRTFCSRTPTRNIPLDSWRPQPRSYLRLG